jgi:WD40-like Beta Propeller Repeat
VNARPFVSASHTATARTGLGADCVCLLLGIVVSLGAAMVAWPLSASAADAFSPSLATFELIERAPTSKNSAPDPSEVALSVFGEDGRSVDRIVTAPFEGGSFLPNPFGGISVSPDGSQLAFIAETHAESPGSSAIYLVNTDGSSLRRLPGSHGALDPVFSPDGTTLAFSRLRTHSPRLVPGKFRPGGGYASTTTWLLDLATGKARQLTPWRNGLSVEPGSFSPDGSTLALTRTDRHRRLGPEVILMPAAVGAAAQLLVAPAEEPDFSPDGRKVAFVGYENPIKIEAEENQGYVIGELYSIGVDGKGLRRLTKNKAIETSPAWDHVGHTHRLRRSRARTRLARRPRKPLLDRQPDP